MSRYASLFSDVPASDGKEHESPPLIAASYHLLIVDDETSVVNALKRVFRQENYVIHTAANSNEALEVLGRKKCQLIISDYMMPGMSGAELLRRIKAEYPDMIRIMLTGHADTNAVMAAIKEGAVYRFILKPWNDDDLRITVALALEQYDLKQKNQSLQKQNASKNKEIKALAKLAVTNRSQLAIMLHKRNLLNDKQVQEIYKQQQMKRGPILKFILDKEWISEKKIRAILNKELMIDEVSLSEFHIDAAIAALLPGSFCERQGVLPIKQAGKRLTLVMADPMDMGLIDDLRFNLDMEIQPVMANLADIEGKVKEVYANEDISFTDMETLVSGSDPYEGIEIVIEDEDDESLEDLLRGTDEPPAIRLVNAIILEAIRLGASDIHIHPRTKSVVVRYRIDGVLQDKIQVPNNMLLSLVSRIKVMAELDITERRRPQDGRITVKSPMRIIDLRISTLPTVNGEKVVMRILDRNATVHALDALGLSADNRRRISTVVAKPQGIILTTGPTGSGKTTTLYSMLQHDATPEKNYVTIEDPVEYYLDQAGQVMIREKIGLDFASVLRAMLRQDPDVILIGEIRDYETAEVAFHAALTGHLVYSTLHTNSAVATIARLLDLGLKPYIIAAALEVIVAQRLVRKICTHCKKEIKPDMTDVAKLGPSFEDTNINYFHGSGCDKCNKSGFSGRIGLYEVLLPSYQMKNLIASGASIEAIAELSKQEGNRDIFDDAKDKVKNGETSYKEVLRVLGPQVII